MPFVVFEKHGDYSTGNVREKSFAPIPGFPMWVRDDTFREHERCCHIYDPEIDDEFEGLTATGPVAKAEVEPERKPETEKPRRRGRSGTGPVIKSEASKG